MGGIVARKRHFIEELKQHYQSIISTAHRAETDAAEGADHLRGESTRKEDTKSAVELTRLEQGHRERRQRAAQELKTLVAFAASRDLRAFGADEPAKLGALVDVSIEGGEGEEERTLFVLPVGAGTELEGPGGDGFLSVVTPKSPIGKALQSACSGDSFDITIAGRDREWTVVDVC